MKEKLQILRKLLDKYPGLHVGGSVGLFLHGIKLDREEKDIDVCMPHENFNKQNATEKTGRFSGHDFDYFISYGNISIEINVDPEQSFDVITYEGDTWRVTSLEIILQYKQKYADRGYSKHINDMAIINSQLQTQ